MKGYLVNTYTAKTGLYSCYGLDPQNHRPVKCYVDKYNKEISDEEVLKRNPMCFLDKEKAEMIMYFSFAYTPVTKYWLREVEI